MTNNPLEGLSSLLGGQGGQSNIVSSILGMLSSGGGGGGLSDLLSKFTDTGLGDKADSWVKEGENASLSPQEVEQAMGSQVDEVAQQAGVSHQEAADGLAQAIPQAVDSLTPGGAMPDQSQIGDMLGKFLGK